MSEMIIDRDCRTCIHANWKSEYDNGCTKWECEYMSREDLEKMKRIADQVIAESAEPEEEE